MAKRTQTHRHREQPAGRQQGGRAGCMQKVKGFGNIN